VIVVDTNVIAGLWLPTKWSRASERLLAKDPEWTAPLLWRSELRNVLATYVRTGNLDLAAALAIADAAETLLAGRDYSVDSASVLRLAASSGRTAYDCEFVALAQHLGTSLVTVDRRLRDAFPDVARDLTTFTGDG